MRIATVVRALVLSGATPEMILAAVEAAEAEQDHKLEQRRASDRERQAKRRQNHVMSRDVTVTGRDTPSDKEKVAPKEINYPPTSSLRSEVGSEPKKATRLKADWLLPPEWRAEAIEAGLPEHLADLEGLKLRDWSLSSEHGAKRDWRAAWRNWYRRAIADLPKPRAGPVAGGGKPTLAKGFGRLVSELVQADEIRSSESREGIRPAIPDLRVVSG